MLIILIFLNKMCVLREIFLSLNSVRDGNFLHYTQR